MSFLNLKALRERMQSNITAQEAAADKIAKAETANDAKGKAEAESEYNTLKTEFATFATKVSEAKSHQQSMKLLGEVDELAAPQGKSERTIPAMAKDSDKTELEHEAIFTDYICGKSLGDNEFAALSPSRANANHPSAIRVPRRLAQTMILGKALPLTSGQASPANLFQSDFRSDILQYQAQGGQLFERATKIPSSSGTVLWPALKQRAPGAEDGVDEFGETGSVAVAWTAEGAEKPGTEPEFEQRNLPSFELCARTEVSKTLLRRSSINIEALLNSLFRQGVGLKLDRAIIAGNGIGKPTGILETVGVAGIARATAAEINYADLVKLEHGVAPQFRVGAVYVVQDKGVQHLKLKVDGSLRPLFISNNMSVREGVKLDMLNGYPCLSLQYMPTLGDPGDIMFGQLSQFICPVEEEIVIARSEHEKFSKGVIVFVVIANVGGKVVQTRAFSKLVAAA